MSRQQFAAHRAETLHCLQVEARIAPRYYDDRYSDPDITPGGAKAAAYYAQQMHDAAMRGRLAEFLDEGKPR